MCKHPLKGFQIGFHISGKPEYKITSFAADHVEKLSNKWIVCMDSFVSPHAEKVQREFVEIPCGKCIDCRLQYSREWADRCMLELKYHDPSECWFLTLTYDDEHIHDFGHDIFPGSLRLKDLQDFLKRLRDHVYRDFEGKKIRFYACGEYGSSTYRPHYHLICYSLPLPDARFFCMSKGGYPLYTSEYLSSIWQNGFVNFGRVNWNTCAYTARYVLKKASGIKPDDYIDQGLVPEFVTMSRKPGIGYKYFEDNHLKIFENDEIFFCSDDGGRKAKPSKYYKRKFSELYPDLADKKKEARKEVAECNKELKLLKTDLNYEELLEVEECYMSQKTKILKNRGLSYV